MGHTIATIFLPRSYCQTYSGYPRLGFVFQQDGALAHRTRDTVAFLERKVQDFISPTLWPPNSPGLNPVDYSIWSALLEEVYRSTIANISEVDMRKGGLGLKTGPGSIIPFSTRLQTYDLLCIVHWLVPY